MKRVKLNYKLVVFLYAYLRQIDLSIDRARWGYWDDFRDYYTTQVRPNKIAALLSKQFNLAITESRIRFSIDDTSASEKLLGYIYQLTTRTCYLKEAEIVYCCQLLNRFDKFLLADFSTYDFQNETLRIDTIRFNYSLIECKLWTKDFFRATQVEHFQQHDNKSVISIGDFLRDLSLEEISDLG